MILILWSSELFEYLEYFCIKSMVSYLLLLLRSPPQDYYDHRYRPSPPLMRVLYCGNAASTDQRNADAAGGGGDAVKV